MMRAVDILTIYYAYQLPRIILCMFAGTVEEQIADPSRR